MKEALDLWSSMIWAMDRALVPEKTFWYVNDFSWQEGNWEYTSRRFSCQPNDERPFRAIPDICLIGPL